MEFYPSEDDACMNILAGSTLIVPAVSIGNVGQLAVDLIIETCKCSRIGRLVHPGILPTAGSASFSHCSGPTFSLELFSLGVVDGERTCSERLDTGSTIDVDNKSGKERFWTGQSVVILQQRSPAAAGLQQAFADALVTWAVERGISRICVLGSLDARYRHGDQLNLQNQKMRRYIPSEFVEKFSDVFGGTDVLQLEEDFEAEGKTLQDRLSPPWPLIRSCKASNMPCAALLRFVLEGDNVEDAVVVANCVANSLSEFSCFNLGSSSTDKGALEWQRPPSWEYAFSNTLASSYRI